MISEKQSSADDFSDFEQWLITSYLRNWLLLVSLIINLTVFFVLFGFTKLFDPSESMLNAFVGTPSGLVMFIPSCILHELVHGLAYLSLKIRPRYGFKFVQGMPALYTTASGCWLSRNQYATVALAPTAIVSLLGIALMVILPAWRNSILMCLVFHSGGCVGDWAAYTKMLQLPKSALFEDTIDGFRYRVPVSK